MNGRPMRYQVQIDDGVGEPTWYSFDADQQCDDGSKVVLLSGGTKVLVVPHSYIKALIATPQEEGQP